MVSIFQRIVNAANISDSAGLASILMGWRSTYFASMHPNGFLVFKIGAAEGWNIRMHVWIESGALRKSKTPVHDHTSNLISLVLKGKLVETRWRYLQDETGNFRRYIVKYNGFSSVLNPSQQIGNLETEFVEERKAGDLYRVSPNEIHSVNCNEYPCVTLCLMDKNLNEGASVFFPVSFSQDLNNNRVVDNREIVERAKVEIDQAISALSLSGSMGPG